MLEVNITGPSTITYVWGMRIDQFRFDEEARHLIIRGKQNHTTLDKLITAVHDKIETLTRVFHFS